MIIGQPNAGKSHVGLDLTATVTTGGTWPDGAQFSAPAGVLLISEEDNPADTIRPRLEAAGADLGRVHILRSISESSFANRSREERGFDLQSDAAALDRHLDELPEIALIIVDPIGDYFGAGGRQRADSYRDSDVRAVLRPLRRIAEERNLALLAIGHFGKGNKPAIEKLLGSIGFVGVARAVYAIMKDPDDEQRSLFLQVKNNIAPISAGLAFKIEQVGPGRSDSRVVWVGPTDMTADEALSRLAEAQQPRAEQTERAKELLRECLADGRKPSTEIESRAEAAGISSSTLNRARKALGVKSVKNGTGWYMELRPSSSPPIASGVQGENLGSLESLGRDLSLNGHTDPLIDSKSAKNANAITIDVVDDLASTSNRWRIEHDSKLGRKVVWVQDGTPLDEVLSELSEDGVPVFLESEHDRIMGLCASERGMEYQRRCSEQRWRRGVSA